MTMVPATDPNLPAIPEDLETGLEDFDTVTDAVMPRIQINHKEATFKDTLSGEEFSSLNVILLGLVKGRILWDDEVNEGDKPLCRSLNFNEGLPNDKTFPWRQSGFNPGDAAEGPAGLVLPCSACPLKEWGSAPNGKTPWCSEQHTFPLLMQVGEGDWAPALITFQRTSLKPSKAYLTSFARSKTPLYTCVTKMSLTPQKRGTVDYAVPSLVKAEATDMAEWSFYAQQYRQIRDFISTPRVDEDAVPSAPAAAPTAAPASAPVAAPASAPVDDDEDLPF